MPRIHVKHHGFAGAVTSSRGMTQPNDLFHGTLEEMLRVRVRVSVCVCVWTMCCLLRAIPLFFSSETTTDSYNLCHAISDGTRMSDAVFSSLITVVRPLQNAALYSDIDGRYCP